MSKVLVLIDLQKYIGWAKAAKGRCPPIRWNGVKASSRVPCDSEHGGHHGGCAHPMNWQNRRTMGG